MRRTKKKAGRPKMDEKDKKVGISAKLHPSIVTRINDRAATERRSFNAIVENVLDENV
jgi:hypothetical protein